mmetsp:Transcript_1529/g.1963  ORF Transcript_1529/g.1963 Transcript_1529/m.1963 type:complete len:93 (+) Transcript_1529:1279-1557(+)
MDLSTSLIKTGIQHDWPEPFDNAFKPSFMRQQDWVPCDCKRCFHCSNGFTHGIDHKTKGKTRRKPAFQIIKCPAERVNLGNARYCSLCYQKF